VSEPTLEQMALEDGYTRIRFLAREIIALRGTCNALGGDVLSIEGRLDALESAPARGDAPRMVNIYERFRELRDELADARRERDEAQVQHAREINHVGTAREEYYRRFKTAERERDEARKELEAALNDWRQSTETANELQAELEYTKQQLAESRTALAKIRDFTSLECDVAASQGIAALGLEAVVDP